MAWISLRKILMQRDGLTSQEAEDCAADIEEQAFVHGGELEGILVSEFHFTQAQAAEVLGEAH